MLEVFYYWLVDDVSRGFGLMQYGERCDQKHCLWVLCAGECCYEMMCTRDCRTMMYELVMTFR